MASDYSLRINAQLDTSDVQTKLQQLGTTGQQVNAQMDTAVKNLDDSVKKLATSFDEASKAQSRLGRYMLRMGVSYIGGKALGQVAQDYKGTNIGMATGIGSGMLQGAAMGMAGGPIGAAVGAVAGGLNEAFEQLAANAETAGEALKSMSAKIDQQGITWANARQKVLEQQELRGIKASDRAQLEVEAITARGRYEDFLTGQSGKHFAETYGRSSDFMQLRDDRLKALQREMEAAEKKFQVAQALEQEENRNIEAKKREREATERKAEAERKAAEAISTQASEALGSFARQQRLEAFSQSLEDMSPADLQNLRDSLAAKKAAAAASVTDLFAQAKTSGSGKDLNAARDALDNFNEITRMLSMTESGLSQLTTPSTPSIQQQMAALGSEAQKGYDTTGYGSIDQEILKSEKSTEQNTKEAASTLKTINTKLEEVKTAITSNANGASWQ